MPSTAFRAVPACALAIIPRWEGLHDGDKRTPNLLEPEADPIGIYTVGYGYALFQGSKPVKDRETAYRMWRARWPNGMTKADAVALLRETAQDVTNRIMPLLGGLPVNDNQLGAFVSLAYNIGVGEWGGKADFADSSVLRLFKAGALMPAADAFRMWKFGGGKVLNGLVNRREEERALFLTPP